MSFSLLRAVGAAAQAGRRRASAGGAPVNTVPPSISGTVAHGNVLTATPGTWTGSPSITGQWYAGASPITGETGTTYTVDRAEGGFFDGITYRETDSVSATSADSNVLEYDYMVGLGAASLSMLFDYAEDVTLVGGEIESIDDQSGNGNTLSALSGTTARPAYDAAYAGMGSQPVGIGDGTADGLRRTFSTLGGTWGPGVHILVARMVTNVAARFVASHVNQFPLVTQSSAGRMRAQWSGADITGTANWTTGPHCLISLATGSNHELYEDGSLIGSAAFSSTAGTNQHAHFVAVAGSSGWSNVAIAFEAMIRGSFTADQLADFTQYSRERWGTA